MPSGRGLLGLADRVSALGGSFRVEGRQPQGTSVHARLPYGPIAGSASSIAGVASRGESRMNPPRQSWLDIVVGVVTAIGCLGVILWMATTDPFVSPGGGLAAPGWAAVWSTAAVLLGVATWLSSHQAPAHGAAGLVVLAAWMGPLMAAIPQAAAPVRAGGHAAGVLLPVALTMMLALPNRRSATPWLLVAWGASLGAALVVLGGYDPLRDPACTRYCVPIAGPISGWSQELVRGVVVLLVAGSLAAGLRAVRITSRRTRSVVAAAFSAGAVMLTWQSPPSPPWHREDVAAALVLSVCALVSADRVTVLRRRQSARSAAAVLLADPRTSLDALDSLPQDVLTGAERLALVNAQLTVRLQVDVAELQESRRRIVEQADDERQRIGRELHDGVQQRVVGTMLHVGALTATADGEDRRSLDAALALMQVQPGALAGGDTAGVLHHCSTAMDWPRRYVTGSPMPRASHWRSTAATRRLDARSRPRRLHRR